jgi:hypothetical protein
VQEAIRKKRVTRSSFNVRILVFEFIWWAVAAIHFWFLRIIFDVDAQFHDFFLSKDNEELFATESMQIFLKLMISCSITKNFGSAQVQSLTPHLMVYILL